MEQHDSKNEGNVLMKHVKLNICGTFIVPGNWNQEDINQYLDSCRILLENDFLNDSIELGVIDLEITE